MMDRIERDQVPCPDCEWRPKRGELWPSEGREAVKWFRKNLILPEGSSFGEPFILRPDQKEFIYEWYSYCQRCDRWRYTEGLRGESTGGGKTTLLAGIALLEFAGPPGIAAVSPNIVVAASTRGQANNLFRKVGQMAGGREDSIRESPLCGLFHVLENTITFKDGRPGLIERVAAEAGGNEGGFPSLFICDELHEWGEPGSSKARNKTVIGKALALDTKIPTPQGWTTMGSIAVGDKVFDENGEQCEVLGTSHIFEGNDCYEVVFSDGTSIVADADHLWAVEEYKSGQYINKILTTRHMHDTGAVMTSQSQVRKRYRIPLAKSIQCSDIDLPIDPYILGYWLGDGDSRAANFTVHKDDYPTFLRNVEMTDLSVLSCNEYNKDTYRVCVTRYGAKGTLHSILKSCDLLLNKHIPDLYLRASEKQRLSLLQGLMDSDGSVSKQGACEFSTTKHRILDGFSELLSSLGIKFSVYEKPYLSARSDSGWSTAWRIYFTPLNIEVFRLDRKQCRIRSTPTGYNSKTYARQIIEIRSVDSVPTKCIAVSSESHLYLAGEKMIPTHNSTTKRNDLRGEGRVLGISTAGFDKNNSLLGDMYKKGQRVRYDQNVDPKMYFTWFEADENLNPDDPEDRKIMVQQASPAAGKQWNIAARVRAWGNPDMPRHEWLRYYANRWVDVGENSWLKEYPGVWKQCKGEWESNNQNPFTIGVDMALKHDTVGVVRCEKLPDNRVAVSHKIWRADPFTGRIDHTAVWDYVLSVAVGEGFRGVVYDPRYFELAARMLEDRGVLVVQFDQSPVRLAPATGLAYKRILENTIVHNGDPDLADQVNSAVAKIVERGGFYLHKGVSRRNIDACVAMCMALYELEQSLDQKPFGVAGSTADNFWKPKAVNWGARSSMWG